MVRWNFRITVGVYETHRQIQKLPNSSESLTNYETIRRFFLLASAWPESFRGWSSPTSLYLGYLVCSFLLTWLSILCISSRFICHNHSWVAYADPNDWHNSWFTYNVTSDVYQNVCLSKIGHNAGGVIADNNDSLIVGFPKLHGFWRWNQKKIWETLVK